MNCLAIFFLGGRELSVKQENTARDDSIEWSPDFVAHVRQDYSQLDPPVDVHVLFMRVAASAACFASSILRYICAFSIVTAA